METHLVLPRLAQRAVLETFLVEWKLDFLATFLLVHPSLKPS